ncbi:hypothetical protein ABIA39_004851 [Nocardia sp. GAS34]
MWTSSRLRGMSNPGPSVRIDHEGRRTAGSEMGANTMDVMTSAAAGAVRIDRRDEEGTA